MNPNVTPRFKVTVDCPDGCGRHGTPLRNGHVRGCFESGCRSCLGRKSQRVGKTKERRARRGLGVPGMNKSVAAAGEEAWRGYFRWEVKAGKQVGPCTTRLLLAERQRDAAQNVAVGDSRPGGVVLMPDGMSDGWVCVRLSVWATHIGPALDEFYGSAA